MLHVHIKALIFPQRIVGIQADARDVGDWGDDVGLRFAHGRAPGSKVKNTLAMTMALGQSEPFTMYRFEIHRLEIPWLEIHRLEIHRLEIHRCLWICEVGREWRKGRVSLRGGGFVWGSGGRLRVIQWRLVPCVWMGDVKKKNRSRGRSFFYGFAWVAEKKSGAYRRLADSAARMAYPPGGRIACAQLNKSGECLP